MSTDRLDRIEAILAKNARQLVESNAAGLRETCAITVPMIADLGRQQQAS